MNQPSKEKLITAKLMRRAWKVHDDNYGNPRQLRMTLESIASDLELLGFTRGVRSVAASMAASKTPFTVESVLALLPQSKGKS